LGGVRQNLQNKKHASDFYVNNTQFVAAEKPFPHKFVTNLWVVGILSGIVQIVHRREKKYPERLEKFTHRATIGAWLRVANRVQI